MTDWRSAEQKAYGIQIRDGLTSRSRESFRSEMQSIIRQICDKEDNLPFMKREIEKDKDWYDLMQREHGEKPGYCGHGTEAIAYLDQAIVALAKARDILAPIVSLETGWTLNDDGFSWSLGKKEQPRDTANPPAPQESAAATG